jgi:hypothetical protein
VRSFKITEVTGDYIEFYDKNTLSLYTPGQQPPNAVPLKWDDNLIMTRGGINRISGDTYVNASQGSDVLLYYELTCKRTTPDRLDQSQP